MRTAFTSVSLFTILIGFTALFFSLIGQSASGNIVPAINFGKNISTIGIQALLPLSMILLFVYFSRAAN